MLDWSAEQVKEITQELIDLEFLPTATNAERGVPKLEFVLQLLHTAPVGVRSYQFAEEIRWRHGEDCRQDTTPIQEEESETCFAR